MESAALLHAILMAAGIALLVVSLCIFIHLLLLFIAIVIIKLSPSSFVFTFTVDYCFDSLKLNGLYCTGCDGTFEKCLDKQ